MPVQALYLLALSGIAGGHAAAYALVPDGHHGNTPVPHEHFAVFAGLAFVISLGVLAGVTAAEARGRSLHVAAWKLASVQVGGFVLLETVERMASSDHHPHVFGERVFWVGVAAQLVLAIVLRRAAWHLPRAAATLLRKATGPAPARGPLRWVPSSGGQIYVRWRSRGTRAPRAPPICVMPTS